MSKLSLRRILTRVHPGKLLFPTVLAFAVALPLDTLDVSAAKLEIPKARHLIDELKNEKDPHLRCRAAWWLGEHEDSHAVEPLIDALGDESADVRLVAAWALGEIKDEDSIDPLIETLEEDDDFLVREMAALALGEIEDPSAVNPLMDALERDENLRAAVVWALGEIEDEGSRKAGRARESIFDDWGRRPWDNDEVWTGTLDERLPHSKNIRRLLEQLENNDAETRREAALNFGTLGINHDYESTEEIEQVVDALIETMRDPEPEVRAAAVWSLDEINPSRSARTHWMRRFKKQG